MKQTAVEWLDEQIKNNVHNTIEEFELILEQAKEMEKEQMKYFIQVGYYAYSQGHKKTEELYEYWINNFKSE